MTAFDPAAWLARFEEAGGGYLITGERIAFGWRDRKNPCWQRAKRMCEEMQDDERRHIIVTHVRERCLIG